MKNTMTTPDEQGCFLHIPITSASRLCPGLKPGLLIVPQNLNLMVVFGQIGL